MHLSLAAPLFWWHLWWFHWVGRRKKGVYEWRSNHNFPRVSQTQSSERHWYTDLAIRTCDFPASNPDKTSCLYFLFLPSKMGGFVQHTKTHMDSKYLLLQILHNWGTQKRCQQLENFKNPFYLRFIDLEIKETTQLFPLRISVLFDNRVIFPNGYRDLENPCGKEQGNDRFSSSMHTHIYIYIKLPVYIYIYVYI